MEATHPLGRGAAALLLVLAAAACSERGEPLAPADSPPTASTAVLLARLECRVDVPTGQTSCTELPPLGDVRAIIDGGQNTRWFLTQSNTRTVADTTLFEMTVKSQLGQPLGTTDGVTPSATGVRMLIASIFVTGGSGTVEAVRQDGNVSLSGPNQAYYQYDGARLGSDGILSYDETSSTRTWGFRKSSTVTAYVYGVHLWADVQYPYGWVDVAPKPASVNPGGTVTLTPTIRSVLGNVESGTVTWSTSNAAVATVSSSGVVTGVAPGTATITATNSSTRSGTTTVLVCQQLALGGVYTADFPAASQFCLGGAGTEYVVMPLNRTASSLPLTITASGIVAVSGAPSPSLLPSLRAATWQGSALQGFGDGEAELRARELEQVAGLMGGGARRSVAPGSGGARRTIIPGVPLVGDLMQINVSSANACSGTDLRTGRVAVVEDRVIILADTMNPSDGLSTADYQEIADRWDTLVWPTLTTPFGAPDDLDGNERVVVFYTRAVNQATASGAPATAGFTLRRDLFSTATCPTSNEGELIYMMAADPSGTINGNARTVAQVKALAGRTLGHEFQHLVNASRRIYVNGAPVFEAPWLDEGLSDIAEELLFYAAAPLSPRSNLGPGSSSSTQAHAAFSAYAEANFARLRLSLLAPHANSDPLAVRGATWAYLRYLADRKGGTESAFWFAVVNSTTLGMPNLSAALGVDPEDWARDVVVATYADDAVSGAAAIHTHPSWNYRGMYGALDFTGDGIADGFPLATLNPSDGVATSVTLGSSTSAYLRMGVGSGGIATVTILSNGAAPPSGVRLAVIRRK